MKDRNWSEELSQDDLLTGSKMVEYCKNAIGDSQWKAEIFEKQMEAATAEALSVTAWRIEGTLREFPKFQPVNCWFRYPIHTADESGVLSDLESETELSGHQKMVEARKKKAEKEKADMLSQIEIAFEGLKNEDGAAPAIGIAEEIGVAPDTIKRWFGKGKRSRSDYKKRFESFENPEDQKLYLRRKDSADEE